MNYSGLDVMASLGGHSWDGVLGMRFARPGSTTKEMCTALTQPHFLICPKT